MLLTLLGFSAACSTVRNGAGNDNGPKSAPESAEEAPEVQQVDTIRTIRLLYGVRRPQVLHENEAGNSGQNGAAKADTTAKADTPTTADTPTKSR